MCPIASPPLLALAGPGAPSSGAATTHRAVAPAAGRAAMISTAVALVAAAVVVVAAGAGCAGELVARRSAAGRGRPPRRAAAGVRAVGDRLVVQAYAVRSLRGDLQPPPVLRGQRCGRQRHRDRGGGRGPVGRWWLAWIVVSLATGRCCSVTTVGRRARAAGRRAWRTFVVGDLALARRGGRRRAVSVGAVTLRPDEMSELAAVGDDRAGPFGAGGAPGDRRGRSRR